MTDPIADLLTRMRNAEMAKHEQCSIPHSQMKESIVSILNDHNYIAGYKVDGSGINKKIVVNLVPDKAYRTQYKRISKPGQRIYRNVKEISSVQNGLGIAIYSTPKGILDNITAKKENVGGEVLCEVW